MKRFCPYMPALAALVLLLVAGGCSSEESAKAPASATSAQQSAASSTPSVRAGSPEASTPTDETPARDIGEGNGTIKGVLKSPYARTAQGVVFVTNVESSKLEPASENPLMDQKNKIFTPHLLPILAGSTVDFPNTDDVRHSVYSRKGSATNFNLGQYEAGVVKHVKFEEVGVTHLACNIHTEMSAYVIARPSPYFALIDRKGNFEISSVPAGRRKLSFFHEKIEPKTIEVTVVPGKETLVEFTGLKRRR